MRNDRKIGEGEIDVDSKRWNNHIRFDHGSITSSIFFEMSHICHSREIVMRLTNTWSRRKISLRYKYLVNQLYNLLSFAFLCTGHGTITMITISLALYSSFNHSL